MTIDVGPFADLTGVANFKRAIERLPAAREIALVEFAGDRARFTLDLGDAVALGRAIRGVVPFNFEMSETDRDTVRITLSTSTGGPGRRPPGPPAAREAT